MTAETKTKKKTQPKEPTLKERLPEIEAAAAKQAEALGPFMGGHAGAALWAHFKRAENMAWALQNFSQFDIAALKLTKPMEIPTGDRKADNSPPAKKTIRVPVFATADMTSGGRYLSRISQALIGAYRRGQLVLEIGQERVVHEINLEGVSLDTTLKAQEPTVPIPVQERVSEVSHRFDRVTLVYEAEWSVEQYAADPLVIGSIGKTHFLIDQYDVTKMESYISSEFTG